MFATIFPSVTVIRIRLAFAGAGRDVFSIASGLLGQPGQECRFLVKAAQNLGRPGTGRVCRLLP